MGLFDFFKKKKADGVKPTSKPVSTTSSARPSYSSTPNQPKPTIKKPSIANVANMIDFGLKWRDKFVEECFSFPPSKVKAEALMFTCWRVWYYCLQEGKVSRDQAYVNDFFAHLMAHLQDDDERFSEVEFFMPLFQNRFGIFRTDLVGLSNSNYPVTKQYLPISTYRVFNLEPLNLIDPSTSSFRSLTMEQMDDMTEFVGKFIKVTNAMQSELPKVF